MLPHCLSNRSAMISLNHFDDCLGNEISKLVVDEKDSSVLDEYYLKYGDWQNFRYKKRKERTLLFVQHKRKDYAFYNFPAPHEKNKALKKTFNGFLVFTLYDGLVNIMNNMKVRYLALNHNHAFRRLGEYGFVEDVLNYVKEYDCFMKLSTVLYFSPYYEDGYYLVFYPYDIDSENSKIYRIHRPDQAKKIFMKEVFRKTYPAVYIVRNFSTIDAIPFVSNMKECNKEICIANIPLFIEKIFTMHRLRRSVTLPS